MKGYDQKRRTAESGQLDFVGFSLKARLLTGHRTHQAHSIKKTAYLAHDRWLADGFYMNWL